VPRRGVLLLRCHIHIPYEYIGRACADDVDADINEMEKTLYYNWYYHNSGSSPRAVQSMIVTYINLEIIHVS
jgi:hypothetical protein